jgi:UDP-glucose 4-epimerase
MTERGRPMNVLVTGGAGFIGSNMVDRLLELGHHVVAYDNLSTGQQRFLANATAHPRFRLERGDILDLPALTEAMAGIDLVMHFAANADVRFGTHHPRRDLEQNTIGTFNVLEAMRTRDVRRLVFSSTGSVYGETPVIPTPEDAPFPIQTSLYGASKVACEALIQAYSEGFGLQAYIFRFVSILGHRYTHGHVFDFYRRLREDPTRLPVLGDGTQRKSYLAVEDCLDAILVAIERADRPVNIFNLGTDEYCQLADSIGWICDHLRIQPALEYGGGARGWIGDNPFIFLDCSRIRALGWKPRFSIREGVLKTLEFLQQNPWVLDERA